MEIKDEFKNERPHQVLKSGTVKELKQKILNSEIGKPSIFIGSSRESLYVAEKVKAHFDKKVFDVNIWNEGIFGKTPSSEKREVGEIVLSNVEWLKNFTDIYDFSIFIFVPEDKIVSQTRTIKSVDGKEITPTALGTKHNVVFEFGMFLGRIGTKKTFVLFDKKATDFVNLFFTDLAENLLDPYNSSFIKPSKNFVSLYPYNGEKNNNISGQTPIPDENLITVVEKIQKEILLNIQSIDINFLPSTTLAIGYFKNFINIFVENINFLRGFSLLDEEKKREKEEAVKKKELEDPNFKETNDLIRNKKFVRLKIVIPNSLEGAIQKQFTPKFNRKKFKQRKILGVNRELTVDCLNESDEVLLNSLIFYDVPTTLNSSIEALDIINPHKDIKELLSEKERQNFRKVLNYKIDECQKLFRNIRETIEIISWSEFLAETKQSQ